MCGICAVLYIKRKQEFQWNFRVKKLHYNSWNFHTISSLLHFVTRNFKYKNELKCSPLFFLSFWTKQNKKSKNGLYYVYVIVEK